MHSLRKTLLVSATTICFCSWVIAQGNVGIGIQNPLSTLHVHGGPNTAIIKLTNEFQGSTDSSGMEFRTLFNGAGLITVKTQTNLGFATDNLERMMINGSGAVTILGDNSGTVSDIFTIETGSAPLNSGMVINSWLDSFGSTYYAYSVLGTVKARQSYSSLYDSWILNVNNSDRLSVNSTGQVAIGSTTPSTSSALLELNSQDRGFLPPRMSTGKRDSIIAPVAGLMVYDSTANRPYSYDGSDWVLSASNWKTDSLPDGIYNTGRVGIGDAPAESSQFYVSTDSTIFAAGLFNSNYSGTAPKYGILCNATSSGSSARYGILSLAYAPETGSAPTFGLYAGAEGNDSGSPTYGLYSNSSGSSGQSYGVFSQASGNETTTDLYGIYASVTGDASGERWAAFFDGDTKVSSRFYISDKFDFLPTGAHNAACLRMMNADGIATVDIKASNNASSQSGQILIKDGDGHVAVQLNAGIGSGRIITGELEIKGGSDLAEYFSSHTKSIAPGSVVCIDPDNPGMVLPSQEKYDTKVIGVVSGANGIKPGMMMGQQSSVAFGDIPVAIAGRVYVRTAETGTAIHPGDFLTTSFNGMAAKVTDWDSSRGAIIGKALSSRDENGFVLVLVHLQ